MGLMTLSLPQLKPPAISTPLNSDSTSSRYLTRPAASFPTLLTPICPLPPSPSVVIMDEIAKEYDVIVLGTGTSPTTPPVVRARVPGVSGAHDARSWWCNMAKLSL